MWPSNPIHGHVPWRNQNWKIHTYPNVHCSTVSPSICHEVMGPYAMILVFWTLNFKPTFLLSSFTFIKQLFSSFLSRWCHPAILSSVVPFSSCPQSFPVQGLFQWVSFASGGQSIGASASASVLPMNIQGWFPLGLTCLISLQSKGLSWVVSNTTVQKHQFFGAQPSLWSNSHIYTWLLEKQ